MELATYSPQDVTVLVAGILPIEGFIDGTFVAIAKDVMPFRSVKSTDGKIHRVYNNDATYTITLTLHNGADSNKDLTRLWLADQVTQMGKFPLLIKDTNGSSLFFSTTSWIETVPTMDFANQVTSREWVIKSAQGIINIGGNTEKSGLIDDLFNSAIASLPILEGLF